MNRLLSLALGGLTGTFARYWIAAWMPMITGARFPYGTMAINLSACLLIGVFNSLSVARSVLGPEARLLLMTGFCGAYSTFSTWILETANLAGGGELLLAAANLVVSVVAGMLLFRLGAAIGMML